MSSFNLNEIFTAGEQITLPTYIERGLLLFMRHGMPSRDALNVVVTSAGYMIGNADGVDYALVRRVAADAAKLLIDTADEVYLLKSARTEGSA